MKIDKSLSLAAVGTDDGVIRIFEINYGDLKKTSLKSERQIHKGRLMDMWIDSKRQLVFTIGEDKYLRTFCLQTGSILNGNKFYPDMQK